MRLPWREEVWQVHPTLSVNIKTPESDTAMEILAEVFQIRPVIGAGKRGARMDFGLQHSVWCQEHEEYWIS
jgi:hypothetical protein